MGFPVNDNERLEQLAEGFRNHSGGVMDGCVLALDGLGVIVHCPCTNDIVAWNDSELRYFLELTQGLPSKYFFIGDEAFTNTQQFLSPWPGRGLDRYKDSFNYWLSHSRQCVERGFGMLTKRWGIF